nr:sugar transferase [Clostridia bacterium]
MNTIEKQKRENIIRQKMFVVKTIHFLLSIALFYGTWLLFRYNEIPSIKETGFRYNYFVTIAFGILVIFFNNTYNSYLFGYTRIRTLALAQSLSHFFSTGIIYLGVCIGWNKLRNPLLFIALIAIYIILDCAFSYWGNAFYFKLNPPKKTLLLYRNKRDRRRFGSINGKPMERLYRIEKEIQFDGTFAEIKGELDQGYDAVFVAGVNSHCRNGILKYCEENNVRGLFLPHVGDVIMQGAQHIQAFDSPVLMVRRKLLRPEYRIVKRMADAVMAALGLIVLSPLFAITALAIKLYDHGPVFYKQVRLTRNAREFISCMSQLMRKRLIFA